MPSSADIQLIAFDLDGTLLNSDLHIAAANLVLLQKLVDDGRIVALASGRTHMSIAPFIAETGRAAAIIACNGARVCAPGPIAANGQPAGPLCAERSLPHDVLGELIEFCLQHELMHNLYVGDEILGPLQANRDPAKYYRDLYATRTNVVHHLVDTRLYRQADSAKFLIVTSPERRNKLYDSMHPQFGARTDMVKTNPEYLEFLSRGIHKGWGLRALCTALKIDPAHTLAVGDGDNDIELFQVAGASVCMVNGSARCKAVATYVTEADHDGRGIAEALERFGLL